MEYAEIARGHSRQEGAHEAPGAGNGRRRARRRASLRGSTLAETLVMMLVAGIVFLTVTDGLTLFNRLLVRRTEALAAAGRQTGGYYRVVSLVTAADSILAPACGRLELYRGGSRAVLSLGDSAVVYDSGGFRDTLLGGVALLQLAEYAGSPDTVEVGFGAGFTARFPVRSPARLYRMALDEIEDGYGYEE